MSTANAVHLADEYYRRISIKKTPSESTNPKVRVTKILKNTASWNVSRPAGRDLSVIQRALSYLGWPIEDEISRGVYGVNTLVAIASIQTVMYNEGLDEDPINGVLRAATIEWICKQCMGTPAEFEVVA